MIIATLLAIVISLVFFAEILLRLRTQANRTVIVWCVLANLPMCWVMFHLVRMPTDRLLVAWLSPESEILMTLRLWYAPLTEEPAKLWILLFPWIRKQIRRENLAVFALALGTGFALGEMVTVAQLVAKKNPQFALMPWYELLGFSIERFLTVGIHAGMTGIALAIWRQGAGIWLGLPAAMCAHFFANLPIALVKWGWTGGNELFNNQLLFYWVTCCFVASLLLLGWLQTGSAKGIITLLTGQAKCPACDTIYDRRQLFAVNMGPSLRYERCPACQKWNWTRRLPHRCPRANKDTTWMIRRKNQNS